MYFLIYSTEYIFLIVTDPNCHPEVNGDKVTFSLSLKNIFECGVTRVKNEKTVSCCQYSHWSK